MQFMPVSVSPCQFSGSACAGVFFLLFYGDNRSIVNDCLWYCIHVCNKCLKPITYATTVFFVVSRGAVRSAASSYAAMRTVAGSRSVLVIAWEWHLGLVLLCGRSGALEYPTTNSCGPINESFILNCSMQHTCTHIYVNVSLFQEAFIPHVTILGQRALFIYPFYENNKGVELANDLSCIQTNA